MILLALRSWGLVLVHRVLAIVLLYRRLLELRRWSWWLKDLLRIGGRCWPLSSHTLLLSSLNNNISSNWDIKIHIFVEVDIRCTRGPVEHLQRDLGIVLHPTRQFDHCLHTFNDLPLDHSCQRKSRIKPSSLRSQSFGSEALFHEVDQLMTYVFQDQQLYVGHISRCSSWQR